MNINKFEFVEVYQQDKLPDLSDVISKIEVEEIPFEFDKSERNAKNTKMDIVLNKLLFVQLNQLGIGNFKQIDFNSIIQKIDIIPSYHKWFKESLRYLSQVDFIEIDKLGRISTSGNFSLEGVWNEWEIEKENWIQEGISIPQLTLIEKTLKDLPKILKGELKATETLFPNSSLDLVEGIYKNDNVVDYFNEVVSLYVIGIIENLLSKHPNYGIRIIEIGAGTGGTSSTLLKRLAPYKTSIIEYCYSDISSTFLDYAKNQYGAENPFLTYKIFNVEKGLREQAITPGSYDIVIATNVLHATRNIRFSLRNAKACLKKNGLLILNEISESFLFTHLTFGLLSGWWEYEDSELRIQGNPGLYPETWKRVLYEEGFGLGEFPVEKAHYLGQQVIIGQSDGVARQPKQVVFPDEVERKENLFHDNRIIEKNNTEKSSKDLNLIRDKGREFFKKLIGDGLKIPYHKIDTKEYLEKYGIDSIVAIQFTEQVSKAYKDVNSTLFFEYPTIEELVAFLIEKDLDSFVNLIGIKDKAVEKKTTTREIKKKTLIPGNQQFDIIKNEIVINDKSLDIAIIGMAGRYPKAKNIEEFWENLKHGKDCITEIPDDRWDYREYFNSEKNKPGKTYCRWGGFLDDVDKFDPLFFHISPNEAELLDPQERLFLENVWELFEDSGYTKEAINNQYQSKIGVFVGAMYQQYRNFSSDLMRDSLLSLASYGSIANRVSYFFNLQGPSIAIDTMCSSSLIAVHMACESLLKRECEMAVAGGVNLSIHPYKYIGLSQLQVLGSHPGSRSFTTGDGYIPSEAVGSILLKPLDKAIQDKDEILAVIKSTSTNHGGKSNGFSAPNPRLQEQLLLNNFKKSGIDPDSIDYIEAAANGSPLGDMVEISTLKKIFGKKKVNKRCSIGSVKSNIGHAEAASGISQLSKVVLQLKHRKLVPLMEPDSINPELKIEDSPFKIQKQFQDWDQPTREKGGKQVAIPRRATVSSFGIGGSNAHIILEEYVNSNSKKTIERDDPETTQLIVISAMTWEQLKSQAKNFHEFVTNNPKINLKDLAYTLQVGRNDMEYRLAIIVSKLDELIDFLQVVIETNNRENASNWRGPIYFGTPKDYDNLNNLLSGSLGEAIIKAILEQNNLEKIALFWVQGGKLNWEVFNNTETRKKIKLPLYPFDKRKYWIGELPLAKKDVESFQIETPPINVNEKSAGSLNYVVKKIVSDIIGISSDELEMKMPLENYGFDSLVATNLLAQIQKSIDKSIDISYLGEWITTEDIIQSLSKRANHSFTDTQKKVSIEEVTKSFPELLHLNDKTEGRPIFWFHPALGGVSIYKSIGDLSNRPFFGIQAKGWGNDDQPLKGIESMASYYVKIIRELQPEGPYDLGGYSMGGVIAYEVARQLQEKKQKVDTIVMLDSLYLKGLKRLQTDMKTIILRTINLALLKTIITEPEKFSDILIHRDEVDNSLGEDEYLDKLVSIAKRRGMKNSKAQIKLIIKHNIKVQIAFEVDQHVIKPLLDSQSPRCYYFRNKSGLFYGNLEPYCSISKPKISIDHTCYWQEWEKQFSNIEIMDLDSSCHMTMFSEKKVYQTIFDFCENLYSMNGLTDDFFISFKKKVEKEHGVKMVK